MVEVTTQGPNEKDSEDTSSVDGLCPPPVRLLRKGHSTLMIVGGMVLSGPHVPSLLSKRMEGQGRTSCNGPSIVHELFIRK